MLAVDETEQEEKVDDISVKIEDKEKQNRVKRPINLQAPPAIAHRLPRGRSRRIISTKWKGVKRAIRLLLCGCFQGRRIRSSLFPPPRPRNTRLQDGDAIGIIVRERALYGFGR